MEILNFFKTNFSLLLVFVRDNLTNIIVVVVAALVFSLSVFVTLASLKRLKIDVFSYYPFDRFFPQSSKWSALYFLTVLFFLGLLIFFLLKGMFYGAPIISTAS